MNHPDALCWTRPQLDHGRCPSSTECTAPEAQAGTETTTTESLDELWTLIREAITATGEAGYQRGRYTYGPDLNHDTYLAAVSRADELVASMWSSLYDLVAAPPSQFLDEL